MSGSTASVWERAQQRSPIAGFARWVLRRAQPWQRTIADADLPAPVASLVTEVVRRTRLRGDERVEVARELIAHFTDALRAGTEPDRAVQHFGNPRTAARLIRRGVIRKRSWLYHTRAWLTRGIASIAVATLLLYVVLAVRYFSGSPTITRHFAANYNARIDQIPESDRAAPLLSEVYAQLEPLNAIDREPWGTAEGEPTREEWHAHQEARRDALIPSLSTTLALAREASTRPHFGAYLMQSVSTEAGPSEYVPIRDANTPLAAALLPRLGELRTISSALDREARLAARRGDDHLVISNLLAMIRLGGLVHQQGFLISGLVGHAIVAHAEHRLAIILRDQPDLLSREHLQSFAHTASAYARSHTTPSFRSELAVTEDLAQRLFTDDGQGDGRLVPGWFEDYLSLGVFSPNSAAVGMSSPLPDLGGPLLTAVGGRADYLRVSTQTVRDAEAWGSLPLWQRGPFPGDPDPEPQGLEGFTPTGLAKLLLPAYDAAILESDRFLQQHDATMTAIALELFRRDTGALPETLKQLVPRYLPAVPIDRWDGNPLRYRIQGDGSPLIYSVGFDRIDDSGTPTRSKFLRWAPREIVDATVGGPEWAEDERAGDTLLYPPTPNNP